MNLNNKNYQDELISLSSKVNEFAFKAPPTEKSIEESGNVGNVPSFTNTDIKSLLKNYGVYLLCPVIVFIFLYISKPNFVKNTINNEDGEEVTELSFKKIGIYTICISLPLLTVYYVYLKKRISNFF